MLKSNASRNDAGAADGFNSQAHRKVCGAFPTGVAIVSTVRGSGEPCGLTINSFTSVSLSPPLILWALKRNSPSREAFDRSETFAISILAEEQEEIARRFARPTPDKFTGIDYFGGELGAPIIRDAIGYLECRRFDRFEAGDHVVYLGLVVHGSHQPEKPPLAFHKGAFRRISDEAPEESTGEAAV